MKLINTDGMAFIGPGSEWFWTALSGLLLAITFLAIYRQLRLQRSVAAIDQLNSIEREWMSERMARSILAIYLAREGGADLADLPTRPATEIGDFWNKVGYLARTGHVDRRLLSENLSPQIRRWWARLEPYARA